MARPSKFSDALLQVICDRLSRGEPLAVICRDEGMPADRTVRSWIIERADVSAAIACAREIGYDHIAADALQIADTPRIGEKVKYNADGEAIEKQTGDTVDRARLQVETRLKLLAKWDPKRYGDRQTLEHVGADGGPIQTNGSPEQIVAQITAVAQSNPMVKHKLRETLQRALEALE